MVTRVEVKEIEGAAELVGRGNAVRMEEAVSLFFALVPLPNLQMNILQGTKQTSPYLPLIHARTPCSDFPSANPSSTLCNFLAPIASSTTNIYELFIGVVVAL